jgi:hypothetical protein
MKRGFKAGATPRYFKQRSGLKIFYSSNDEKALFIQHQYALSEAHIAIVLSIHFLLPIKSCDARTRFWIPHQVRDDDVI